MWLLVLIVAGVVGLATAYAAAWRNMAACYELAGPCPEPAVQASRRPPRPRRRAAPGRWGGNAGALPAG